MPNIKERLTEIFDNTIDTGLKYEGSHTSLDYYNLFCKAASNNNLYKVLGNNVCMFNCSYENSDAIMVLFSIPINASESVGNKSIADRIMEIIYGIEECFITADYMKSEEVKEDKFVYITVIKKIGDKNE